MKNHCAPSPLPMPRMATRTAAMVLLASLCVACGAKDEPAAPAASAPATSSAPIQANGQTDGQADGPGVDLAFSALFGVQSAGESARTGTQQQTRLWFQTPLTQAGQHYWAQFFVSQDLDDEGEPIDSHAQGVSISALTYVQQDAGWQLVSRQRDFSATGSYGDAPQAEAELLSLSPTHSAALVQATAFGQGYSYAGKTVLLFDGNSWSDAGYIGTSEDNAGTCDDAPENPPGTEAPGDEADGEDEADDFTLAPCYAWAGSISLTPAEESPNPAMPDLVVQRHSTLTAEQEALRPAPDATSRLRVVYHFEDGQYRSPAEVNR